MARDPFFGLLPEFCIHGRFVIFNVEFLPWTKKIFGNFSAYQLL
jgi:hypothetical protein